MRKIILTLIMSVAVSFGLSGQGVRHQVQLGAGPLFEGGSCSYNGDTGVAFSLSYGLEIGLGGNWAVMPAVGYRAQGSEFHIGRPSLVLRCRGLYWSSEPAVAIS